MYAICSYRLITTSSNQISKLIDSTKGTIFPFSPILELHITSYCALMSYEANIVLLFVAMI